MISGSEIANPPAVDSGSSALRSMSSWRSRLVLAEEHWSLDSLSKLSVSTRQLLRLLLDVEAPDSHPSRTHSLHFRACVPAFMPACCPSLPSADGLLLDTADLTCFLSCHPPATYPVTLSPAYHTTVTNPATILPPTLPPVLPPAATIQIPRYRQCHDSPIRPGQLHV